MKKLLLTTAMLAALAGNASAGDIRLSQKGLNQLPWIKAHLLFMLMLGSGMALVLLSAKVFSFLASTN